MSPLSCSEWLQPTSVMPLSRFLLQFCCLLDANGTGIYSLPQNRLTTVRDAPYKRRDVTEINSRNFTSLFTMGSVQQQRDLPLSSTLAPVSSHSPHQNRSPLYRITDTVRDHHSCGRRPATRDVACENPALTIY